jgi:hypothetical protein
LGSGIVFRGRKTTPLQKYKVNLSFSLLPSFILPVFKENERFPGKYESDFNEE